MLGLKLPTDPRWVNIVEKNVSEILTDHAYCEQKAASSAISLIISFPEKSELVTAMTELVAEEISHFKSVHDLILERGETLGKERRDKYVRKVTNFFPKGDSREVHLVHRLLYCALIEARSCERFRLLSEQLEDKKLRVFYRKLMISEANHYTLFINFARKYAPEKIDVEARWQQLLSYEAEVMQDLSKQQTIHG